MNINKALDKARRWEGTKPTLCVQSLRTIFAYKSLE